MSRTASRKKGVKESEHFAPGYVPHPTKTMWERHVDMHNIEQDSQRAPRPYVYLGPEKGSKERPKPADIRDVEEVVGANKEFTARELRWHFGFNSTMIRRYRAERKRETRYAQMTREQRERIAARHGFSLEREKRIISYRLDNEMTYDQIGKLENITRERVRQILFKAEKKYGIQLPRNGKFPEKPVIRVAMHCKVCGKIREVKETEKEIWKNNFCDEHRMGPEKYKNYLKEPKILEWDDVQYALWKYHNDPRVNAVAKNASKNWRDKLKKNPERWAKFKAREKAYLKQYYANKEAKQKEEFKPRPFVEVPDHDQDL